MWVSNRTGGKLVNNYINKCNVILNMQQAVNGRCIWEITWQVGSEMTWKKNPNTKQNSKAQN